MKAPQRSLLDKASRILPAPLNDTHVDDVLSLEPYGKVLRREWSSENEVPSILASVEENMVFGVVSGE
ncbi:hypothetical protein RB195_016036 [Necator americanus]|uniref:Uncharacterized protein n=1 Tax=Necator americanus TaxID=51031 RepID=A0ABR1E799_NECAM